MACTEPRTAWKYGAHEKSGKQKLVFYEPQDILDPETQLVPCGKCVSCKLDYSREWATRIEHEMKIARVGMFLTLTISDDKLIREGFYRDEKDKDGETHSISYPGFSVYKRSLQLFLKRLRKKIAIQRINSKTGRRQNIYQSFRYLGCGEYGTKKQRAHYHLCIMGYDLPDKRYWKTSTSGEILYRSETLEKLWPYGYSSIGQVNWNTAAYVARYTLKKTKDGRTYEHTDKATGEWNQLRPEFLIMSKGIGKTWWAKYRTDTDKDYIIVNENKRVKVPRYYDKLREDLNPESLETIKKEREQRAKEKQENDTKEMRISRNIINTKNESLLIRGLDHESKEALQPIRQANSGSPKSANVR